MEDYNIKIELDPESKRLLKENNELLLNLVGSGKRTLSEDWLQITDIAEILGVSTKTVRRRIIDEGLKGKKLGRKLYFHKSEVERMLGKQSNN